MRACHYRAATFMAFGIRRAAPTGVGPAAHEPLRWRGRRQRPARGRSVKPSPPKSGVSILLKPIEPSTAWGRPDLSGRDRQIPAVHLVPQSVIASAMAPGIALPSARVRSRSAPPPRSWRRRRLPRTSGVLVPTWTAAAVGRGRRVAGTQAPKAGRPTDDVLTQVGDRVVGAGRRVASASRGARRAIGDGEQDVAGLGRGGSGDRWRGCIGCHTSTVCPPASPGTLKIAPT